MNDDGTFVVSLLRERQRTAWQDGSPIRVEALIAEEQTLDAQHLLELILSEFHVRREFGENPSVDEYINRFPSLSERLHRLFSLQDVFEGTSPDRSASDTSTVTSLSEPISDSAVGPLDISPADGLPARVGHYEIEEEIARGGMGIVYRARDRRLGRTVALKVIRSPERASKDELKRFVAEAEAAALLDHPGIVPVYEVGQFEGQHFIAMAFVEGRSLWQVVKDGPFEPGTAARIIQQAAEAMQYAHDRGIVHRDIKPHNILLQESRSDKERTKDAGSIGRATSVGSTAVRKNNSTFGSGIAGKESSWADLVVRVTDFGLAKRLNGDSSLTRTGQVFGTPSYMPPEQAAGIQKEIGITTDVYSLGATLYCLLTGRPPFQGANVRDTLRQVFEQDAVPLRQLNAQIPRDLETICLKCLAKQPGHRYASAMELAADLGRFLKGEPINARPVNQFERAWRWCRRNPLASSLAACVATLLIAVGSIALIGYERERSRHLEIAAHYLESLFAQCRSLSLAREPGWRRQTDDIIRTAIASNPVRTLADSRFQNLSAQSLLSWDWCEEASFKFSQVPSHLAVNTTGNEIAAIVGNTVEFCEVGKPRARSFWNSPDPAMLTVVVHDPTSKRVACGDTTGTIHVLDRSGTTTTATRTKVFPIAVQAMVFGPGPGQLTATHGEAVVIVDCRTGEILAQQSVFRSDTSPEPVAAPVTDPVVDNHEDESDRGPNVVSLLAIPDSQSILVLGKKSPPLKMKLHQNADRFDLETIDLSQELPSAKNIRMGLSRDQRFVLIACNEPRWGVEREPGRLPAWASEIPRGRRSSILTPSTAPEPVEEMKADIPASEAPAPAGPADPEVDRAPKPQTDPANETGMMQRAEKMLVRGLVFPSAFHERMESRNGPLTRDQDSSSCAGNSCEPSNSSGELHSSNKATPVDIPRREFQKRLPDEVIPVAFSPTNLLSVLANAEPVDGERPAPRPRTARDPSTHSESADRPAELTQFERPISAGLAGPLQTAYVYALDLTTDKRVAVDQDEIVPTLRLGKLIGMSISSDHERVLLMGSSGHVLAYHWAKPEIELFGTWNTNRSDVTNVAFSGDGNRFVMLRSENEAVTWRLDGLDHSDYLRGGAPEWTKISINTARGLVAVSAWNRPLEVRKTDTGGKVGQCEQTFVREVHWTHDGSRLLMITPLDPSSKVLSQFRYLRIASWDNSVSDLSLPATIQPTFEQEISFPVLTMAVSPDDRTVVLGGRNGGIVVGTLDGTVWSQNQILGDPNLTILNVVIDQKGKQLAAATYTGAVQIWSMTDWRLIHELLPTERAGANGQIPLASAIAFGVDGRSLIVGYDSREAILWNWSENGSPPTQTKLFSEANPNETSPLGNRSSGSSQAHASSLEHQQEGVWISAAASPDGRFLALGNQSGKIALLTREGRILTQWLGHSMGTHQLGFERQGKLISDGFDGHVRRWHLDRLEVSLRERGLPWNPSSPMPEPNISIR